MPLAQPVPHLPALEDWIQIRGSEPGPLFCAVLKSGRLQREAGQLAHLSPAAAWRICRQRGRQAQIPAIGPHDLRRTWIGDLLDLGVDLATVQKMAGHASASTTGRYDRQDRRVQHLAATLLHVPYEPVRLENPKLTMEDNMRIEGFGIPVAWSLCCLSAVCSLQVSNR